jgi:hypothetical protein
MRRSVVEGCCVEVPECGAGSSINVKLHAGVEVALHAFIDENGGSPAAVATKAAP